MSNKAAHYITAKIGDAGVPRQAAHYITAKMGDAGVPRHVNSGPRPTFRDRRHDEQRGSPYDTKCNLAEIGAANMGDIGAVRKRIR